MTPIGETMIRWKSEKGGGGVAPQGKQQRRDWARWGSPPHWNRRQHTIKQYTCKDNPRKTTNSSLQHQSVTNNQGQTRQHHYNHHQVYTGTAESKTGVPSGPPLWLGNCGTQTQARRRGRQKTMMMMTMMTTLAIRCEELFIVISLVSIHHPKAETKTCQKEAKPARTKRRQWYELWWWNTLLGASEATTTTLSETKTSQNVHTFVSPVDENLLDSNRHNAESPPQTPWSPVPFENAQIPFGTPQLLKQPCGQDILIGPGCWVQLDSEPGSVVL